MTFFDEPSQPESRSRPSGGGSSSGRSPDSRTAHTRQLIAVAIGVVVILLLVLGVRSCAGAKKDQAFEDYVRDTSALVRESDQQSQSVFRLLSGDESSGDVDIANQLNALARQSEQIVDRARGTDRPDEVGAAQDQLVESLEFRRDGLKAIAAELPTAIAQQSDKREGTGKIAASMQNFLTSDVIYQTRVQPQVTAALKDQEIAGSGLPDSQYLPAIDWLDPSTVSDRVGTLGTRSGKADEKAAPGLHGTGVTGVSLGGQALTPGSSPVSVTASDDLSLEVQVTNQGENTETDVKVKVTIGKGSDATDLDGTIDEVAAGETQTAEIAVKDTPPTGQTVPVKVSVEPVPGEKKTDNNEEEYSAIFTS